MTAVGSVSSRMHVLCTQWVAGRWMQGSLLALRRRRRGTGVPVGVLPVVIMNVLWLHTCLFPARLARLHPARLAEGPP
jgi:hypothetical protein